MPASNYPNSGGTYGSITLSGNGSWRNLTPTTTGTYAGIVIFQDPRQLQGDHRQRQRFGHDRDASTPRRSLLLSESGNRPAHRAALIVDTLTISGNTASPTR